MTSAIQELRHEGLAFLYRGILPPLAQRTVSLSLMFGLYDGTKRPLINLGVNEYVAKVLAGLTAGKPIFGQILEYFFYFNTFE